MKTRSKVVLDEWAGRLGVLVLNLLARLLGKVLNIDHSFRSIPERIVVCKFLGMGSIIQSTPMLQSLRKSFPNARIYFVTSASNESIMRKIQVVNDVWCVDDKNVYSVVRSTLKLLRKCWSKKIDLYIDLETYSYYSTAVATMSMARNRLGFYRAERNIRMGVYTHMMFFNPRAPIAESYMQMARLVGCREIEKELYPFKVSTEDNESCRQKIRSLHANAESTYLVINPNASDLRVERRWPIENFAGLIQSLSSEFPELKFYLIGSGQERQWVQKLQELIPASLHEKVFNTAGMFSLGELFALISGARLTITNDTGPMHISFALRKPTVCLFGPASPSQYGQNPFAFGLYKNIYCSPCVHEFLTPPCKGDNQCMKLISVDEVDALCKRLLRDEHILPPEYPAFPQQFAVTNGMNTLGLVDRS